MNGGADDLEALIAAQRAALLASGAQACDRLEAASTALAAAIKRIATGETLAPAPLRARALRSALQANRVALNRLKAANDRALLARFGEPDAARLHCQGTSSKPTPLVV